jgi:hypothetical protein
MTKQTFKRPSTVLKKLNLSSIELNIQPNVPVPAPQVVLTTQDMLRLYRLTHPIVCNKQSKCRQCQ